ncbi:MAG: aromatic ring-hydroxylating dioxygenase subunit alpha [Scytolyngbya sp. HA4215-MV1]|jgi:phenylpropionate dioxygenase-like ring-hydroxylating dioxygenase large terminal subunit|nr:aromatic ring-hydroxylating dioxygenase subunit alpha [Scytolyngbya sp. HA4215-MV1]
MLVTQQPILRRFWYPVMPIAQLQTAPQSFQLLGQPLVLWLDAARNPVALDDRCCHRTARLSQGSVVAGNVRCPYHGWTFDGTGTCIEVPQCPDRPIPKTYRVPAFRCTERYGYVWVCLADPLTPIPDIPEAIDPHFRQIPQFYEPWRCAGLRLMENSFDNAHPQFVHAKTFGLAQEPVPPDPDEFEETPWGLRMKYILPVFNLDVQKQNLQTQETRTVRMSEGTWFMPFIRTLKITYPTGLIHIIFTAATPIDDRTSQIIQFCLRNDTEAEVSAENVIAFDRAVTLEDKNILEGTHYDVPLNMREEQHMTTDKPGIVMRHKLAALLRSHGETEQRLPSQSPLC